MTSLEKIKERSKSISTRNNLQVGGCDFFKFWCIWESLWCAVVRHCTVLFSIPTTVHQSAHLITSTHPPEYVDLAYIPLHHPFALLLI